MNPEIENLINMAIADGEVTEKERAIILRKAESLGIDMDEVEMILDGRIALIHKEKNSTQEIFYSKSNKAGDSKKCPSCGAPVQSFSTQCSDCGHEFNNLKANSQVSQLAIDLNKIEKDMTDYTRKENNYSSTDWVQNSELEDRINEKKASLINSFPIPNTKEDILEFLTLSVPLALVKLNWYDRYVVRRGQQQLINAWKAKAEQTIMKARFSMREDKNALKEIETYANLLK